MDRPDAVPADATYTDGEWTLDVPQEDGSVLHRGWFPSGRLAWENTRQDGVLQGVGVDYYDDDEHAVSYRCHYRDGQQVDAEFFRHPTLPSPPFAHAGDGVVAGWDHVDEEGYWRGTEYRLADGRICALDGTPAPERPAGLPERTYWMSLPEQRWVRVRNDNQRTQQLGLLCHWSADGRLVLADYFHPDPRMGSGGVLRLGDHPYVMGHPLLSAAAAQDVTGVQEAIDLGLHTLPGTLEQAATDPATRYLVPRLRATPHLPGPIADFPCPDRPEGVDPAAVWAPGHPDGGAWLLMDIDPDGGPITGEQRVWRRNRLSVVTWDQDVPVLREVYRGMTAEPDQLWWRFERDPRRPGRQRVIQFSDGTVVSDVLTSTGEIDTGVEVAGPLPASIAGITDEPWDSYEGADGESGAELGRLTRLLAQPDTELAWAALHEMDDELVDDGALGTATVPVLTWAVRAAVAGDSPIADDIYRELLRCATADFESGVAVGVAQALHSPDGPDLHTATGPVAPLYRIVFEHRRLWAARARDPELDVAARAVAITLLSLIAALDGELDDRTLLADLRAEGEPLLIAEAVHGLALSTPDLGTEPALAALTDSDARIRFCAAAALVLMRSPSRAEAVPVLVHALSTPNGFEELLLSPGDAQWTAGQLLTLLVEEGEQSVLDLLIARDLTPNAKGLRTLLKAEATGA